MKLNGVSVADVFAGYFIEQLSIVPVTGVIAERYLCNAVGYRTAELNPTFGPISPSARFCKRATRSACNYIVYGMLVINNYAVVASYVRFG